MNKIISKINIIGEGLIKEKLAQSLSLSKDEEKIICAAGQGRIF